MSHQPSEIFVEILRIVYPKNLSANVVKLHQTLFTLRERFPEIMEKYQYKKIGNPYSTTLANLLTMFQLAGVLQMCDTLSPFYRIVPERLNKFPQNQELLNLFSRQKELKALYA